MKFPVKSISVGGAVFRIEHDPKIKDWAEMRFDERTIALNKPKCSPAEFRRLVRHELAHAALAMSGLDEMLKESRLEEALVCCIENLLFPAIDELEGAMNRTHETVTT